MQNDIVDYYKKRANEYERIYQKPERQNDLERLRRLLKETFRGQHILELSCGTGYWTEALAPEAASVLALDINPEVLEIARGKNWSETPVRFMEADSYSLPELDQPVTAVFSGFWWSHIPRLRLPAFLAGLHAKLSPDTKVMFIDNRLVEGSSTPISRTSPDGDTFQQRHLADGSSHEVMKNFPSEIELLDAVTGLSSQAEVLHTDYFWALTYRTR